MPGTARVIPAGPALTASASFGSLFHVMATEEPRVGGVTLRQYAGVVVGVAEGFALDEVLGNEGVEPRRWRRAEEAWAERLDDDEAALDEAFDERLHSARARYGRRVRPLDEELQPWLDLVRRWAAAEAKMELLAELGLRSADLLRLHRLWSERLAQDPALQRRAQAILATEPAALPPIELGPSTLVPGPDHGAPVELDADDDDEEDDEDDDDLADVDLDALATRDEALPALFTPLPGSEEEAAPAPIAAAPPRLAPPAAAPLGPPPEVPGSAPAAAPSAPALVQPAPVPPPVVASAPVVPAPPPSRPAQDPLAATVMGVDISAVRAALPFLEKERAARQAALAAAKASPAAAAAPPPAAAASAAPLPVAAPSDEPATLPAQPSFLPTTGELPAELVKRLAQAALPFRPASPAPAAERDLVLTVAQYASLCAELAVFPQQSEAIFARYGLASVKQRVAVDLAWQARLRRDPAEQAAWQAAYQRWQAHLLARPRSP
jgi:hypothetical protein